MGSSSSSAISTSVPARPAVVARQARHPGLGVEHQHPVLGQVDRWPDDRHLGAAVGQARCGVGEVVLDWLDGDLGVGGLEVPDQAEQQVRAGADQVTDPEHAGRVPDSVTRLSTTASTPAERLLHLRQPRRAELGQRDLTGAAGEQHDAELVLELFDRRRQRGLGDEQPLGGAPVVQLLAEHGEVPQLPQRDVRGGPPRECEPHDESGTETVARFTLRACGGLRVARQSEQPFGDDVQLHLVVPP